MTGHFENCSLLRSGQFTGLKGQGQGPLEKSEKMAHSMFCPRQKKHHILLESDIHWHFCIPIHMGAIASGPNHV